jgi:hypothetical protein
MVGGKNKWSQKGMNVCTADDEHKFLRVYVQDGRLIIFIMVVQSRVARWYIFIPSITILVQFGRRWHDRFFAYFMDIWYFYDRLVQ